MTIPRHGQHIFNRTLEVVQENVALVEGCAYRYLDIEERSIVTTPGQKPSRHLSTFFYVSEFFLAYGALMFNHPDKLVIRKANADDFVPSVAP